MLELTLFCVDKRGPWPWCVKEILSSKSFLMLLFNLFLIYFSLWEVSLAFPVLSCLHVFNIIGPGTCAVIRTLYKNRILLKWEVIAWFQFYFATTFMCLIYLHASSEEQRWQVTILFPYKRFIKAPEFRFCFLASVSYAISFQRVNYPEISIKKSLCMTV